MESSKHTVWMPQVHQELHLRWRKWIVLRKLQLRGEHAAFEGGVLGPLDQGFPHEHIILRHWASGDALGRVRRETPVFLEETLGCGGCHGRHASVDVAGWEADCQRRWYS